MERNPDSASVRVEIESTTSRSASDVSNGDGLLPSNGQRSTPTLVGVGAVLVAVVVGLVLLSPDGNEAADGTRRGTTTTVPSTTSSPESTTSSTSSVVDEVGLRPVVPVGGPEHSTEIIEVEGMSIVPIEIISSGGGYVALGATDGQSPNPVLFGSAAGQYWVRLEGRLADGILSEPTSDVTVERIYEALGEVDGGLAVSLLERFVDRESGETVSLSVKRLITADGSSWTLDPDFQVIELDAVAASPSFNGPDLTAVAVLPAGRGNPLIERVLSEWASDPQIADGCFISAFPNIGASGVEDGFRLQSCDERSLVDVTPDQLVAPESADFLQLCLQQLSIRSAPPTDIYMQRKGEQSFRIFSIGTSASTPVPAAGGDFAAVLVPGTSLATAPACEPFDAPGRGSGGDPGVSLFSPGIGSIRAPSSGILGSTPLFEDRIPIAASESQVVVPLVGKVYSVDIATGIWTLAAETVRTTDRVSVAPNGRQIFTANGRHLFYASIGEPWQTLGVDRGLPRQSFVLHADDTRVFFSDGANTLMVELPQ